MSPSQVTVSSSFRLLRQGAERAGARPIAHQTDLQAANARAQLGRGAQQHFDALPAVQATHVEHREARGIRRVNGQQAAPFGQVDGLGNHRGQAIQAVEFAGARGGIGAGDQHPRGAADVDALARGLHPHGEAGGAALEAHFVGDHALERGHVPGCGGDAVAIHVEAHREIDPAAARRRALNSSRSSV